MAPTREQCIELLRQQYDREGVRVLSWSWQHKFDNCYIYDRLRALKTSLRDVALLWDIEEDFKANLRQLKTQLKWSKEDLLRVAAEIVDTHGHFPVITSLAELGYIGFTNAMRKHGFSYDELKVRFDVSDDVRKVSVNGLYLKSAAEACVANFLCACGIDPMYPRKYPEEYSEMSGNSWGLFDLGFKSNRLALLDQIIDLEVWGGPTRGGEESRLKYETTRRAKEEFNKDNKNFVGIEVDDCYSDQKLAEILKPFVDTSAMTHNSRTLAQSAALESIAKSTIEKCRLVMDKLDIDHLPTKHWFAREGEYKNVPREAWEPPNLMDDIKMCGGLNKMRELLGLAQVNKPATIGEVIQDSRDIFALHGVCPRSLMNKLKCQAIRTPSEEQLAKRCLTIINFMQRHYGRDGYKKGMQAADIPFRDGRYKDQNPF